MSWLDVLFGGYSTIQANGVAAIQRTIANLIGPTVADNPNTGATDITIVGPVAPTLVAPVTINNGGGDKVIEFLESGGVAVADFGPTFGVALIQHETRSGIGGNAGGVLAFKAQDGQDVSGGTNNAGGPIRFEYGQPGSGGTGGANGWFEFGDPSRVAGVGLFRLPHPGGWDNGTLLACKQAVSGSYKLIRIASDDLTWGDVALDTTTIEAGVTSFTAKVNGTARLSLTGSNATVSATSEVDFVVGSSTTSVDGTKLALGAGVKTIQFPTDDSPATIYQPARASTGANNGAGMVIAAQDGQAQTGGANNNDGGGVTVASGSAGTGGSGTAGAAGNVELRVGGTQRVLATPSSVALTGGSVDLSGTTKSEALLAGSAFTANVTSGHPVRYVVTATLQTTNATPTVIHTLTLPTNCVGLMRSEVLLKSGNNAGATLDWQMVKCNSGTATVNAHAYLAASFNSLVNERDAALAAATCTAAASGATIVWTATGVGATTIDWTLVLEILIFNP